MAQNGPRMTQNDPKWPKNDPKLPQMAQKLRPDLRTFSAIFSTEKAVPQTFSLLECMILFLSQIVILILVIIKLCLLVNGSSVLA